MVFVLLKYSLIERYGLLNSLKTQMFTAFCFIFFFCSSYFFDVTQIKTAPQSKVVALFIFCWNVATNCIVWLTYLFEMLWKWKYFQCHFESLLYSNNKILNLWLFHVAHDDENLLRSDKHINFEWQQGHFAQWWNSSNCLFCLNLKWFFFSTQCFAYYYCKYLSNNHCLFFLSWFCEAKKWTMSLEKSEKKFIRSHNNKEKLWLNFRSTIKANRRKNMAV